MGAAPAARPRQKERIPLKLKKLLPIVILALLLVWFFLPEGESVQFKRQ